MADSLAPAVPQEYGLLLEEPVQRRGGRPGLVEAAERGAAVVQRGVMPGGIQFVYLSAPQAGVPYVELAYVSPEMRAFYDYIKQEQR